MSRLSQTLRWGVYFSLALGLHGAAAAVLLARWNDSADLVASAPLILIDLAPVAVAPTLVPNDMPPDVVESKLVEPEPELVESKLVEPTPEPEPEPEKPVEKIELPPDPAALPELTAALPPRRPPEKKVEKKKPQQRTASLARAASSADNKAERAAAPTPGANARDSNAIPNWRSQLVARLERNKRYPAEAQARGETGTVQLAFTVDRNGGAHGVRLVRSSGSSALDRETLTLIDRAAPFPPPPPELGGGQIAIVVPIRYLPPR